MFVRHCCRAKQRFLDRDRKHIRNAYMAYRLFYEISGLARRKSPSREDFEKSTVYDAFVRFGQYMEDINAIDPENFVRYVIASKKGVDRWCSDALYMEYVRALNKNEDGVRASERNLRLMISWANQESGRQFFNFFREIKPALAIQWIMSGRISPWVMFNCESGQSLISGLSAEQFGLLEKAIDIKFWDRKFTERRDEVSIVQEFLKDEGL